MHVLMVMLGGVLLLGLSGGQRPVQARGLWACAALASAGRRRAADAGPGVAMDAPAGRRMADQPGAVGRGRAGDAADAALVTGMIRSWLPIYPNSESRCEVDRATIESGKLCFSDIDPIA